MNGAQAKAYSGAHGKVASSSIQSSDWPDEHAGRVKDFTPEAR